MADPMTSERLDELVDIDPLQLRDAAIALLAERDEMAARLDAQAVEHRETGQARAAEVERLREEERRQRETAEAASRGWRIEVAEVERLRAGLDATEIDLRQERTVHARTLDERDRLAEQVKRVREVHLKELDAHGIPVCAVCRDAYEEPVTWPCTTMAALDGPEASG